MAHVRTVIAAITCRQEFDAHQMVYLNGGNYAKVHRVKSKFDGVEYAIKRSKLAVTSEAEAKRWQQVGNACMRPPCLVAECMQ